MKQFFLVLLVFFFNISYSQNIDTCKKSKNRYIKEYSKDSSYLTRYTLSCLGDTIEYSSFKIVNNKGELYGNNKLTLDNKTKVIRFYEKGKLIGNIIELDSLGNLYKIETILNDSIRLVTEYYPNGNLKAMGYLKNMQKVGEWKFYYESGLIQMRGEFLVIEITNKNIKELSLLYGFENMRGNYISIKSNKWVYFSETGKQIKEENY